MKKQTRALITLFLNALRSSTLDGLWIVNQNKEHGGFIKTIERFSKGLEFDKMKTPSSDKKRS